MTNKEIALAALGKAQKNGLKIPFPYNQKSWWCNLRSNRQVNFALNGFLLSFDFAKAFWGTEVIYLRFPDGGYKHKTFGGLLWYDYDEGAAIEYTTENWKYHLQKMVLEKNIFNYLKQFIS